MHLQRVPPASDLAPPAPASLVAPVAPPDDLDTVDDRWFGFLQNGEGLLKGGQEHLSCKVWNNRSDAVDDRWFGFLDGAHGVSQTLTDSLCLVNSPALRPGHCGRQVVRLPAERCVIAVLTAS